MSIMLTKHTNRVVKVKFKILQYLLVRKKIQFQITYQHIKRIFTYITKVRSKCSKNHTTMVPSNKVIIEKHQINCTLVL